MSPRPAIGLAWPDRVADVLWLTHLFPLETR